MHKKHKQSQTEILWLFAFLKTFICSFKTAQSRTFLLKNNITNKRVIIVEDIIDTGTTLNYLKDYLNIKYKPKEIKLCCLIDKIPARKVKLDADYVGYYLNESKFLVGYGFDYNELFREVPYIFVPDNEDLNKWDELLKKNN